MTSPPREPDEFAYALLGPLAVRRGGAEVIVPPGKQRALLAALLLRNGRLAGVDELAEALWGEQPPPSARVSLHNYVARLRRVLGGPVIVTEAGGYRILLGPGELDADRFEAAMAAGRTAAQAGDWAGAAASLRAGLALWRGEALAGIGSDVLAVRHGTRLAELRWQAEEALAEADLRLGHQAEAITALRRLTAEQPLRERMHALLMTALYQHGQQAAALAAYQDARAVLAQDLGAEPGPDLRELHRRILAADPALAGPEPGLLAPPAPSIGPGGPAVRYSLPPDAAAFTGRADELDQVMGALADAAGPGGLVAVSAIDGMPGAGKTALALHAAHLLASRFPDRQLFIDLHAHTPGRDPVTPEDALAALLTATGTDARFLPDGLEGRAALWRDKLAGQRALLVLDNAASSVQVAPLLPGSAGCLVLVTSRRHLADLPVAVTPVLVGALPPAQAAEMFTRLAPRAASHPGEVAEVVGLAGCLPLAVSLLARLLTRHPSWTLADLAAETQASLLTLTPENASVAAAFEVSYRNLDGGLQRLFCLLGLHPGTTADSRAAAALAGTSAEEASQQLDRLHGEGLLTETGYRRYGLHDLLRRYARDHAAALPAGDAQAALGRLLDYYTRAAAGTAVRLGRQTRPGPALPTLAEPLPLPDLGDDIRALAWARAERASLVACLDHVTAAGQHARVIGLTAALTGLLWRDGPWADAITRHTAAIEAARSIGDRLSQGSALNDLGIARWLTADFPAAAQALEQALEVYRDAGDRLGEANARCNLGFVRHMTGDFGAAVELLERALDGYREVGDRLGEANALNFLGNVRQLTGGYQEAVGFLEQALGIYHELGHRFGQVNALNDLGILRMQTGDYPAAAAVLKQALATCRDLGARLGEANALNFLGTVWQLTGDNRAAAQALEQALASYRELGNRVGQANALNCLGHVAQAEGDYPAAITALKQALGICRDIGSRLGQANAFSSLGAVAQQTGDYPEAAGLLDQALALYRELGDRGGEAEALNNRATVHRQSGELTSARECHQQALDVARAIVSARDEANALAGLGRCALAVGHAAEGRDLLAQALETFQRIGAAEAPEVAAELAALAAPRPRP